MPDLVEGNWYYDYAGYLIDYQQADGKWHDRAWPNGESDVNATSCALLVLGKAVLPPPPGIDKIHIGIDHMRVEFDPRPDLDAIKVLSARFQLEEGASYNLDQDCVRVTFDGVVSITIPAGSFVKKKKEVYDYMTAPGV